MSSAEAARLKDISAIKGVRQNQIIGYGLVIVEDDTTSFLVEDPPPPLARLAPDLVWFLSSTSKSIGPGLRIGYLLLPAAEPGPLAGAIDQKCPLATNRFRD